MAETVSQLFARIEQQVKDEIAKQDIVCPKCGYVWEGEEMYNHISYYGEDPPEQDECSNCEAKVMIKEEVVRTFEVTLADEPEDE